MDTEAFDYDLPADRIAQGPLETREAARLLVDRGADAPPDHARVADLPGLLRPGDVLVLNDTRVRAARLSLRKATGAAVEVLLLDEFDDGRWQALVRRSRKLPPGTIVTSADGRLAVQIDDDLGDGLREVAVLHGDPADHGELPRPPYIHEALADPERYQTVYSRRPASAAAPTAGLHLTEEVLDRCLGRGVTVVNVELVVGLDTFRPIGVDRLEDHVMHTEAYTVPEATMAACEAAAGRVVAVGTTSVRALEAAAATGELTGRTDLFIRRGFEFRMVDLLLTNFHVPRTTLLALVDAFVGPRWRELYEIALKEGYRFLSFGDAMLLKREQ